jgi:hypothetical protein
MSIEPLLYGYDDAAKIIGIVGKDYLRKHKTKLPHTQIGANVGFSLEQCREIAEMHAVRPGAVEPPANTPPALLELRPRGARRTG